MKDSNGHKKIEESSNSGESRTGIFIIAHIFVVVGFFIIIVFFGL